MDIHILILGTGEKVKIPGKSPWEPNVYPFGTTYEEIYKDLVKKDKKIYKGTISALRDGRGVGGCGIFGPFLYNFVSID